MAEYSIEFAKELLAAAKSISLDAASSIEKQRAVLYLSELACELALKALLESAGFPIKEITSLSHNLSALLEKVGSCKVKIDGSWRRATQIRGIVADDRFPDTTIGRLLDAEKSGASGYPNNIRYGDLIRHFPADTMLAAAERASDWAAENIQQIKR